MTDVDDQLVEYMVKTVQMSTDHVAKGGIPFSAVVVHPRYGIIGAGVNRVAEDHDPTAHAEIVALRAASAEHQRFQLSGCTLLASGEPCALCYLTTLYYGVRRVRYAVDRHGAAAAGFDYSGSYSVFASQPQAWAGMDTRLLAVEGGDEPFQRWLALHQP